MFYMKTKPLSIRNCEQVRLIRAIYFLKQRYFIEEKHNAMDSRINIFIVNFKKWNNRIYKHNIKLKVVKTMTLF